MIVLGIETSCDDTAVALVSDRTQILADERASQDRFHASFRGVVPEIASRKHLEFILPLVQNALDAASVGPEAVDAIAVTSRPGLFGSLLVGVNLAKSLAWAWKKPLLSVNHLSAHLFSLQFSGNLPYPHVGLIVSGGHTLLTFVRDPLEIQILGGTIDDACGEAFDKIAKHLDLPYPGGPALDKLAQEGDENAVAYPLVTLEGSSYDFSYSGLKTAVLYSTQKLKRKESPTRADIAASFQKAALGVLFKKAERACEAFQIRDVGIAGGVSANSFLRRHVSQEKNIRYHFPPLSLCTDNAVMVAGLGHVMAERRLGEAAPLALMPSPRNPKADQLV